MDGQYVFEEIKQKYKISNKYMLCVTYEDIGILISIIEVLNKQLKYRKEEINIKSKIKAKIEELQTMYDGLPKNPKEHLHSKTEYKIVIGVLQELLDERNKNNGN